MPHQGFSSGGAHPGDIIQYRFHLGLTVQGSVILNCKAVSLVLDSGDQLEPFRMCVDRKPATLYPFLVRMSLIIILMNAASSQIKIFLAINFSSVYLVYSLLIL